MNLGKMVLCGIIAGLLLGVTLTIVVSVISIIPILNLFTIFLFPFLWLITAIAGPAIVLAKYSKTLQKGDGIAMGAILGLVLAIVFGVTMSIASLFTTSINIGVQGKTEATTLDGLMMMGWFMIYLIAGFVGAIPSAITGAISGWFFENRWRIDKVEVVKEK